MDKKRILVIDDEAGLTHALKLSLEGTGRYTVQEENHPESGLATARQFRPDLILLDVMMPTMTGDELAGTFMNDAGLKLVPIVFLTAVVSKEEVAAKGHRIGSTPCEFLAKPVSTKEVVDCIEKILGT